MNPDSADRLCSAEIATPLGLMTASFGAGALLFFEFKEEERKAEDGSAGDGVRHGGGSVRLVSCDAQAGSNTASLADRLASELGGYFAGTRTAFSIPLAPSGTPFQKRVWAQLRTIPYGSTLTYAEQAVALGDPKAVRASASANGKNPIAILIPCHRVIGSDGSLTGYAGGLGRKKFLLELERGRRSPELPGLT